jgi:hypothetical protein
MNTPDITHNALRQTVMEYEPAVDVRDEDDPPSSIVITEWPDNEGVDIRISSDAEEMEDYFSMTFGQWHALKAAMKAHIDQP